MAIAEVKPGERARSPKWPKVRAEHLQANPACAACGLSHETMEVHHIQPFHLHPELELEPANLITLCEHPSHNCHLIFGHLLDFRSYNTAVTENAAAYLLKVDSRPYE